MNTITSHNPLQALNVSNHPIYLVRLAYSHLRKFLQDPKSKLVRLFFVNESCRQIRTEGRESLFRYLSTVLLYTNFSNRVCSRKHTDGQEILPYSIEFLANKAGITLQTAKKWNSILSKIGYLKVRRQIIWDKHSCKFSSKPSIKVLTDIFFHDLGIKEKVLRRTIEISREVAKKAIIKARSLNDYIKDEISHIRKKTKKSPEVKHTTEKIPRSVFDIFKKNIF